MTRRKFSLVTLVGILVPRPRQRILCGVWMEGPLGTYSCSTTDPRGLDSKLLGNIRQMQSRGYKITKRFYV